MLIPVPADVLRAHGAPDHYFPELLNVVAHTSAAMGVSELEATALWAQLFATGSAPAYILNRFTGRDVPIYELLAESLALPTTEDVYARVRAGDVAVGDVLTAYDLYMRRNHPDD